MPDDSTFNQFDNPYEKAAYKALCAEFGIDPSSDFRFTHGANHGLGNVYVWGKSVGLVKTDFAYPGFNKFSDEGGAANKGNLIQYSETGGEADNQYDWFAPNSASGLTNAGLTRINESIEAYVYCILGGQVGARTSIVNNDGGSGEAQKSFKK